MTTPAKNDIVEIEFSSSHMVMRKTPLVWHSHLFHSRAQCCQLSMLWMELFAEVRIETDWEVQICSAIWKKLYFIEGWQEGNLRCFFPFKLSSLLRFVVWKPMDLNTFLWFLVWKPVGGNFQPLWMSLFQLRKLFVLDCIFCIYTLCTRMLYILWSNKSFRDWQILAAQKAQITFSSFVDWGFFPPT